MRDDDPLWETPQLPSTWPGVQTVELAQRLAKKVIRLEARLDRTRDRLKALEGNRSLAKAYSSDELKSLRRAVAQLARRLEELESRLEGQTQVAKAATGVGHDPLLTRAQGGNPSELLGCLAKIVKDPQRVSAIEHYANRGDVAAMLRLLSLEERGQLARMLQGL
jgi:hypothetical protein